MENCWFQLGLIILKPISWCQPAESGGWGHPGLVFAGSLLCRSSRSAFVGSFFPTPPLLFFFKCMFCECANAVTFCGAARSSGSGCSPACQGDEGFESYVQTPEPLGSSTRLQSR